MHLVPVRPPARLGDVSTDPRPDGRPDLLPDDPTAPRRRYDLPGVIALAIVAVTAGLILSRNATREAAERAEAPPRPDCVRFPGACDATVAAEPPPGFAARAGELAFAETRWNETLATGRRTGAIPDKALTALRDGLGTTAAALRDARALLQAAATRADSFAAGGALEVAYEHRLALLAQGMRAFEDVPSPVSSAGEQTVDEGVGIAPGAPVRVRLQSGSVRIIGWSHDSVHVTGRLAPGERWVTVAGAAATDTTVLRAEGLPRGLAAPSEIEIRVPQGSPLVVRAAAASLVVRDLDAPLDVATAAGNLLVESVRAPVRAETMQGTLSVIGPLPALEAATVSGALLVSVPYDTTLVGEERVIRRRVGVETPFGPVSLRSVSGRVTFSAPRVVRGGVHTVRGDARVLAGPLPGGTLQVTSHAGLTTIVWPVAAGDVEPGAAASGAAAAGAAPARAGPSAVLDVASLRGGVTGLPTDASGVPGPESGVGRLVVRAVRGDVSVVHEP